MSASGTPALQRKEDEARGGCPSLLSPSVPGTRRHLPRGIVIQLTGTEGEWDSLDDGELDFPPDGHEDDPPAAQLPQDEDGGLRSQSFHVPLSPSSPGSLGNCSPAGPGFLSPGPASPTHRPLASVGRSLSTELDPQEDSSLRPRPLLSLGKSISTELSRSEPEVSQSRSDSRLNLHLWKQLTQQRTRSTPPSPSSLSPSGEGPRGGFFRTELEDTRRKLSEAVQEPLSSMFSKILREEGGGGPKHQNSSGVLGRDGSTDTALSDPLGRITRRTDLDAFPVFDWPPVRAPGRIHCPVHRRRRDRDVCTDADVMQMFTVKTRTSPAGPAPPPPPQPPRPLPRLSLFCVAVLSYGYLVLPLSSYVSGLALGLALGFLLGLLLIRMGSSRSSCSDPAHRPAAPVLGGHVLTAGSDNTQPDVLKGWMNEIRDYQPETCHPALTQSVFVTLDGSSLRLDTPRHNISRRAAAADRHRVHEATFVKSRCFQLANSKVYLLPPVLARKRLWNPKYPVCIQLAPCQEGPGGRAQHDPVQEPRTGQKEPPELPYRLYLFGRTGREKEEWFHRLTSASTATERQRDGAPPGRSGEPAQRAPVPVPVPVPVQVPGSRGSSRVGSSDEDAPSPPPTAPSGTTRTGSGLDYPSYMAGLVAAEQLSPVSSPGASGAEPSPTVRGTVRETCTCDLMALPQTSQTSWINALIGRIFWDFLREKSWADAVSHKVQKKLSRIRLPHFMNELTLTELDMGSSLPQITAASRPEVNQRGLWVELQLVYTGNLQMTLQTKFNLSRLGREGGQDPEHRTPQGLLGCRPVLDVLADSDEESSSAASSDEEELDCEPLGPVGENGSAPAPAGTGRKILRLVDRITKSKCFQKAAENEFIRRKFEEMSNTPLLLTVEVQELTGNLLVNVPPPPTDRIWYSFCLPPKLELQVRPQLGERAVTCCHVTEWIQKKLQDEFQKVFVLPNMDDVYLPLMRSVVGGAPATRPRPPQSSSTESVERIPPGRHGAESN